MSLMVRWDAAALAICDEVLAMRLPPAARRAEIARRLGVESIEDEQMRKGYKRNKRTLTFAAQRPITQRPEQNNSAADLTKRADLTGGSSAAVQAGDEGPPTQRSVRVPVVSGVATGAGAGEEYLPGPSLAGSDAERGVARAVAVEAPPPPCRAFVAPRTPPEPGPEDHERVLILPDQHFPCHDQAATDLAIAIGMRFKPTAIVNLGDALDFAPLSRHMRSKKVHSLRGEQDEGRKFFRACDAIGARTKVLTMGNHCTYLDRFIHSQAPALADLDGMSVDEMLGLSANGWRVIPYMQGLDMGGVHYTHEVGHCGIHAVRTSLEKMAHSVVIGHVHSMTSIELHSIQGVSQTGHSFGWLGDRSTIDYKHRARAEREWPHGVGLAESDGVHTWFTPIVMHDKSRVAYVHGKSVRA